MTRNHNFYYRADPSAAIGDSIARAMFGDPQAAQVQAQSQAQIDAQHAAAERARAAAGYDVARTTGVNTANTAQAGLPDLIAAFLHSQQPAAAPPPVNSPDFANFDQPFPQAAPHPDQATSLAALIGAMGQMNGDKVDPTKIMGTVGAFGGGDEMARRGLIAQGHTPGADFAITPDRADTIAATAAQSELAKALGVARANHANDLPVANIRAGATLGSARIRASSKGATAAGKTPKPTKITAATNKALLQEMKLQIPGFADAGTPRARAYLLAKAEEAYQQTGSISGAVQKALEDNRSTPAAKARHASADPIPVETPEEAQQLAPGTRYKTPDGTVYTR